MSPFRRNFANVKRNLSTVVGEIYFKKGIGHIIPDDKKLKLDIEIPKKKNLGSVDGHKVVVEIESIENELNIVESFPAYRWI